MVGKHIFVSGRVQGVGFRYFTQQLAQEYEVVGWVRNLNDGRVEIVAFGEQENLQDFLRDVSRGPQGNNVTEFKVEDVSAQPVFYEFSIRRDGGPTWSKQ